MKDDNDSKAWQEVATVLEFRKALAYAIDAEEIVDSVYYGYAEVNTSTPAPPMIPITPTSCWTTWA